MMWHTAWMHRCTGPSGQKSSTLGSTRFWAVESRMSTSSEMPWFLAALMGTTGTPRALLSFFTSMLPPLPVSSSIMFRAITVGTCNASSCKVKYRFRSILVASTMLMMASGLEPKIKSRVTISSWV